MASIKRKIKRRMQRIANDNVKLRPYIRGFITWYERCRYRLETWNLRTDEKVVVFCSFQGASYSDNPRALFEYMMRRGDFEGWTFVWGFKKKNLSAGRRQLRKLKNRIVGEIYNAEQGLGTADSEEEEEPADFQDETEAWENPEADAVPFDEEEARIAERKAEICGRLPNVVSVIYNSKSWRRYVGLAKYWIFNFKIDDSLSPRRDQIFLQTWHGTPLKRLGFDLEHFDNALNTQEGIKKRYELEVKKFTWFISPSPFSTEKFKSAWRMEDFGRGDIILEEGYPRNDILINYTQEKAESVKRRILGYYYPPYEQLVKRRTIVLYAPTYRSDQHTTGVGYTYKAEIDFDRLRRDLGEDFIILFRAHYFVASKFNFSKYSGFVYNVSKVQDINDLYLISDILVTDYSSSMFDYANLRRPMIFYMYDLEHYRDESNGFYFDPEEELPGPIVRTEDELVDALRRAVPEFTYDEKYRRFNEKFDPYDDGHVCERVVGRVFRFQS